MLPEELMTMDDDQTEEQLLVAAPLGFGSKLCRLREFQAKNEREYGPWQQSMARLHAARSLQRIWSTRCKI